MKGASAVGRVPSIQSYIIVFLNVIYFQLAWNLSSDFKFMMVRTCEMLILETKSVVLISIDFFPTEAAMINGREYNIAPPGISFPPSRSEETILPVYNTAKEFSTARGVERAGDNALTPQQDTPRSIIRVCDAPHPRSFISRTEHMV